MGGRALVFILVMYIEMWTLQSNLDNTVLSILQEEWNNMPSNWNGANPCREESWEGVGCTNERVTSIQLGSVGLTGKLPPDVAQLSELLILDLSYNNGLTGPIPTSVGNLKKLEKLSLIGCSFSGSIPGSLGSLQNLQFLTLNSNGFTGEIPPSLGNLSSLVYLDLSNNSLTGGMPISNATALGLDLLVQTLHFHFGDNQLSGVIPSQLFSSEMALIHLLFQNNQLTGGIPSTLGLVPNLAVVRLDNNFLNGPVPSNLNNLTHVIDLYLSNNMLNGPLPTLTGMNDLGYVDMSNNSFDMSDFPPWSSTLQSLTTLVLEHTNLQGQVPKDLFSIPQLQTVVLRNNHLNGTFDTGSSYSSQLNRVDLQNNSISGLTVEAGPPFELILVGNPFCRITKGREQYCILPEQANSSSAAPPDNCLPTLCNNSDQTSSPNCKCAYPYMGVLNFWAPSFSNLINVTGPLQLALMSYFKLNQLPVDSVALSNPTKNLNDYLLINLEIFPSGDDRFNHTGISGIAYLFSSQIFKPPKKFGPYYFIPENYQKFSTGNSTKKHNSSSTAAIIGGAAGGCVVLLLLVVVGVYAFRQKRIAERATQQSNPFASWDPKSGSGGVPQLIGAKPFTFENLKKCTNNFSEANAIGSGGYGKVYRGTLTTGLLVAIKRAEQRSLQGGLEFKTEIELLSRVHHKNVVSLVGFCFEQGEQILVYEYIPNGTLKDCLSGKSGIRLDWSRRLRIALGAAKGIQYLHDLANPPIIHRDIKSNNVLLDEHLNAKVSDFGLSKPMGDPERGHVTTQVKGTMGYLDPEYYMTQQLTEKSDVYSFGVLMLEVITAKRPIENGKYIVRELKLAMDKSKELYNLQGILDPAFALTPTPRGLEKFVDLAMRCVSDSGDQRPRMSEVVKEIENIMLLAGLDPNIDLASASASEEMSGALDHPYSDKSLFIYSATYQNPKVLPK